MYDLLTIAPATLYGQTGPAVESPALAASVPMYGAALALEIDPRSAVPDCWVYFDGEANAYPLNRGAVIRRRFTRIRVAPQLPGSFPAALAMPAGSTTATLAPACGSLVLRAWRVEPPAVAYGSAAAMINVQQQLAQLHAGGGGATATIGWARVTGARQVTCWASNDNTAQTHAVTLNLYTVRPQVTNGATVRTALALGTLLGSATIPAAADGGNRVEISIWYPGVYEVAWQVVLPPTGNYAIASGVEVTYAQP